MPTFDYSAYNASGKLVRGIISAESERLARKTLKDKKLLASSINQGDFIGTVGSTGRSTGPHLDFRINWFQTRLDPMTVLK